jgi:serpin B
MDDQTKPSASSMPQAYASSDTLPTSNPVNGPTAPKAEPIVISPSSNTTPPKKSHKKVLVAVGILLLLAIISAGVYRFNKRDNTAISTTGTKVASSITSANNNFGLDVFNQLVKQSPQDNIFISPASIAMALSMVYNGAGGPTRTAMQKVLNYQGLNLNTINGSNLSLISSLKNPDPKVTLAIANSVWLKQGVSVNKTFLNTTQHYYQAKATTLNFSSPSAPTTINNWVSNATDGKITSIVKNIPSSEIMYLINAVYFKGAWHTVFDSSQTQNSPFTTGRGTSIQTPLMSQTGTYNYYSDSSVQAIQLPYGKNQRISMNVYLPTDMTTFLQNLSYSQLANIDNQYTQQQGTILLPKFTLTYSQSLKNTLESLGMGIAFNPFDAANFNGIARNTYITDVEHKTYIAVDEQGTVAAAVTSVDVGMSVAIEPSGFYMDVNKPFVLTIQDSSTKEVLFVGIIQDPSQ